MKLTRVVLAATLTLIGACSDSTDPGGFGASGSMAFNFTGGGGGSYSADGGFPNSQSQINTTTWAVGYADNTDNVTVITSHRVRTNSRFDEVLIIIPRLTPGTATVDVNCNADDCAELIFLVNTNATGSAFDFLCGLTTGNLTISTISSTRATGTFSGTGSCFDGAGAETSFIVSGGTFDVALASSIPGSLLRQ